MFTTANNKLISNILFPTHTHNLLILNAKSTSLHFTPETRRFFSDLQIQLIKFKWNTNNKIKLSIYTLIKKKKDEKKCVYSNH